MSRQQSKQYLKPLHDPGIADAPMPMPPDIDYCPYPHKYVCDKSYIYRSFDGSCNNLQDPIIGRSMTPHRRLLPAVYHDGKLFITFTACSYTTYYISGIVMDCAEECELEQVCVGKASSCFSLYG